jgi:hypothetical protein
MPASNTSPRTGDLRQGDVRLLDTPTAQHLLATGLLARLAYTGGDGTPRLIPINFVWTGEEVAMAVFAGTYKVRDLRARPHVALCIDTADGPPQVLMLRGKVTMTEVEGVLNEYAQTQRRVLGVQASAAYLQAIDQPGLRMVRLGLRPTWVGVLDFTERFPERTPQPVLDALRS